MAQGDHPPDPACVSLVRVAPQVGKDRAGYDEVPDGLAQLTDQLSARGKVDEAADVDGLDGTRAVAADRERPLRPGALPGRGRRPRHPLQACGGVDDRKT